MDGERDVGLYGTAFDLKNPTPPGAACIIKIPRGDTNGVYDDEVTITSGLHTSKQKEQRRQKRGCIRTGKKQEARPKGLNLEVR